MQTLLLAHSCCSCTWHTWAPVTAISGSVHPSARVFTSSKHSPDRTTLTPVFTSYSSLLISPWNILSGDAPNRLSDSSGNIPHSFTSAPISALKHSTAEGSNLIPLWKFLKFLGGFSFLFTIQSHICTNSFFPVAQSMPVLLRMSLYWFVRGTSPRISAVGTQ